MVRQAARLQERAAADAPRPTDGQFACLARRLLARTGTVAETDSLPSAIRDTTATSLLMLGYLDAMYGHVEGAKAHLERFSEKPKKERRLYGADSDCLRSWIEAAAKNWEGVVRLAEPYAVEGDIPWCGRLPTRWLVAESYEQLGDQVAAARHYELVLSHVGTDESDNRILRGLLFSFAHRRLVLMYSEMGRIEDARRHWEVLENTLTNPDPELVPMIEEARRAREEAETKAVP